MATSDQALPQDTTTEIIGKPGQQTTEFFTVLFAIIADIALGVFHKSVNLTGNSAAYIGLAASGASGLYALGRSILKGRTHSAIATSLANRYITIHDHAGAATHILDVVDGFLFAVNQEGGPVKVGSQIVHDIQVGNGTDLDDLVTKIADGLKARGISITGAVQKIEAEVKDDAEGALSKIFGQTSPTSSFDLLAAPGDAAPSANVRSAPDADAPQVADDPLEPTAA